MSLSMSIQSINERIQSEICYDTLAALTDENLRNTYMECDSVKKKLQEIRALLHEFGMDGDVEKAEKFLNRYVDLNIPAGTKGNTRGNMFNSIVKAKIEQYGLDPGRFDVCFELLCPEHPTAEKPDWYIRDRNNNRVLIGMNQLDLWSGGHQTNRGDKYINNNKHNTSNSKLLCVVCNKIKLAKKCKKYELFNVGFQENTLCYLGNLQRIIRDYFGINEQSD